MLTLDSPGEALRPNAAIGAAAGPPPGEETNRTDEGEVTNMDRNAIWQLTPIDGAPNADWDRSVIRPRPIVVRAASEEAARRVASAAFGTGRWGETLMSPWEEDSSVQCDRMEAEDWPVQGRAEILALGFSVAADTSGAPRRSAKRS
jgi:hypothetical protein